MSEEITIGLMIDVVFNNFNDDVELLARWLFKNGYIDKNADGDYILKKDYKPFLMVGSELREYDYAFKQLQEQLSLKQCDIDTLQKDFKNARQIIDEYRARFEKAEKKIKKLQQENKQLKQQLKDIEEYLESIKDMPDADMYIKLGEYKEFKHILDLIHKGSE